MALKLKLSAADHTGLDDATKTLYRKDGDFFVLDVEGLEDTAGLKSAFEKTQKELKEVRKQLDKVKDIDPEKYQELLTKQSELELKEKEQRGEFESAKQQILNAHKTELEAERKKTQSFEEKWRQEHGLRINEMIEREALSAISDAKGNRTLLLPQLRTHMRVIEEDGKPVVVQVFDPKTGTPKVDGKGQPMSARVLLDEWRNTEDYAGAFAGTGSSGSGSPAAGRFGQNGSVITLSREEAKDPTTYRQAKERAAKEGKTIQIQASA